MRSSRTRSVLVSAFVLALAGLGWFYLAPTQIGGSTTYVITHGISMEPLIHAGDLVLVRPESDYRVGQVVAYRSTLLHTVVLHRIIGIEHGHYTFKGDNNGFIDPTHPTRALLVGRMWLHVPGGGVILDWLHRPWVAAVLFGAVAGFLLFGGEQRRRRRDRGRRRGGTQPTRTARPVTSVARQSARSMSRRDRLVACTLGAVVFGVLCVVAFVLPANTTVVARQPYTQTLKFSYRANVQPSAVYPSGTVSTGDPVYIQLVHLLTVTAAYRMTTAAPNRLHGTIGIRGMLSNSSGWSRSFQLAPPTPFAGPAAHATAQINLRRFESLANRISTQIGAGSTSSYNLTVTPTVKIAGRIAGQPVSAVYGPTLNLALGAPQLLGGSSAIVPPGSGTSSQPSLVHRTPGAAVTVHSSTNTIAGVPVEAVRWLALLAFVLSALGAWITYQRERENPPDPADRINSRYKHLIVPIEPITPSPDHPPIEVSSIDALAQLAERSERLILHDHREDVDNYLIDDQGTLYQFSAPRVRADYVGERGHANGTGGSPLDAAVPAAERDGPRLAGDRDTERGHAAGSVEAGPAEPDAGDPAADAAAAIFRTAAEKLAAAATQAASATQPAAATSHAPDAGAGQEQSGADPSGGADRRGVSDRPDVPRPPGDTGQPRAADQPPAEDRPSGPDRRLGTDRRVGTDRRLGPDRPGGSDAPLLSDRRFGADRRLGADRPADAPPPRPRFSDDTRGRAAADREDPTMTSSEQTGAAAEGEVRPVPDILVFDAEAPQPPIASPSHWSTRPEVRAGLALGPIALTILAWRRLRARRRRMRGDSYYEEQRSARRPWTTRNLPRR